MLRFRRIVSVLALFTGIPVAESTPMAPQYNSVDSFFSNGISKADGIQSLSVSENLIQDLPKGFDGIRNFTIIENQGQVSAEVKFYAKIPNGTIWFTDSEIVFDRFISNEVNNDDKDQSRTKAPKEHKASLNSNEANRDVVRLQWKGDVKTPKLKGLKKRSGTVNYFLGDDKERWQADVPTYKEVYYENIYAGIDLRFYQNGNQLEYDFIVHPNVDPKQIQLVMEGVNRLRVDHVGNMVVSSDNSKLLHKTPISHQEIDNEKIDVKSQFSFNLSLKDTNQLASIESSDKYRFGFELGEYDKNHQLVIDPQISFSTYLGGNETLGPNGAEDAFEEVTGMVVNDAGEIYLAGYTSSTDFPSVNAVYPNLWGDRDAFIVKMSKDGQKIEYATFVGGGGYDSANDIALDSSGNVYITGVTGSSDFPSINSIYPQLYGYADAFIFKLSSDGQTPQYSSYLGGTGSEEGIAIALDSSENIYVVGHTYSTDFPTVNPIYPNLYGPSDIFIFKLHQNRNEVLYSTYLGGSGSHPYSSGSGTDSVIDADVDNAGNLYLTGITAADDFPTVDAIFPALNGTEDAFVFKINPEGDEVIYSTYLGGSDDALGLNWDSGEGIAVDNQGNAYIVGYTSSLDFYTSSEALYPTALSNDFDGFITKINPSGSNIIFSTYFGGSGDDRIFDVSLDDEDIVIAGSTASTDFPIQSPFFHTLQGYGTNPAPYDGFISKLSNNGQTLLYSTYWGGEKSDSITSITSKNDYIYVAGNTNSDDFPTKDPKYSELWGERDIFVSKIKPDLFVTGELDHFSLSTVTSPQTKGVTFPITIKARDENFNHITTYSGKVHMTSSSGPISPTEVNMVNGVASANIKLFDQGNERVNVSAAGGTGNSNYFSVEGFEVCTGSVSGKIYDLPGDAVNNAAVTLSGNGVYESAQSNIFGKYSFSNIPCNVNYFITASQGNAINTVKDKIGALHNKVNITIDINGVGLKDTPVILIPGMLGSSTQKYNFPRLPKETPAPAKDLDIFFEALGGWKDIEESLKVDGYTVLRCPWDWRLKLQDAQKYLVDCIDDALQLPNSTSEKVHVVAHSMGGLLTRQYIQSNIYRGDIDKFAMVGTPNLGSANAYYIWEGGDPKLIDDISDEGATQFINAYTNSIQNLWTLTYKKTGSWLYGNGLLGPDQLTRREFIIDTAPSLKQLLSIEPMLREKGEPDRIITSEESDNTILDSRKWINNRNTWLEDLNSDSNVNRMTPTGSAASVELGVFAGKKTDSTINKIKVGAYTPTDTIYPDGRPVEPAKKSWEKKSGDGTVLYDSAVWPIGEGIGRLICGSSQEEHASLVKDYQAQIIAFINSSASINCAPSSGVSARLLSTASAAATPALNNFSIASTGSIRFDLSNAQDQHSGIDEATDSTNTDIPNSEVIFKSAFGEVSVTEPSTGNYTVEVFGIQGRDFIISIGAEIGEQQYSKSLHAFHSNNNIGFSINLESAGDPKITIIPPVESVSNLAADITSSDGTQLTWDESTASGIIEYRIYGKHDLEPYYEHIETKPFGTTEFVTADLWSSDGFTSATTYAVTAVKADGKESFFSIQVLNNDRDHDGLSDAVELEFGSDITKFDTDMDGLSDLEEMNYGTNPNEEDTDGDSYSDFEEINKETNPLDSESKPKSEDLCFPIKAKNGNVTVICL